MDFTRLLLIDINNMINLSYVMPAEYKFVGKTLTNTKNFGQSLKIRFWRWREKLKII